MPRKRIFAAVAALLALAVSIPLFLFPTQASTENQLYTEGASFRLVKTSTNTEISDDSTTPLFQYNLWEPGYTVTEHFTLECGNTNEAFTYSFQLKGDDGSLTALASVIDVYWRETQSPLTGSRDEVLLQMQYLGTLDQVLQDEELFSSTGTGSIGFEIALQMRPSAGNAYQSMSLYKNGEEDRCFHVVLHASVNP